MADIIIETLLGLESYRALREHADPADLHRLLICKWIYVQGFLNNDFPATERYVPAHLQDELDHELQ